MIAYIRSGGKTQVRFFDPNVRRRRLHRLHRVRDDYRSGSRKFSQVAHFFRRFLSNTPSLENPLVKQPLLAAILGLWACAGCPLLAADEADDALAKQLVGTVRDPRLSLRQRLEAARMLNKLGPRAAVVVPDLTAQLKRLRGVEHEPLQEEIIETLGRIGSPSKSALPTLATNTGRSIDLDLAVKRASERVILSDDSQDLAALLQQLGSRDVGLRLRAVKTLGLQRSAASLAVPTLTQLLADPDGDVRRASANAIRAIQPDGKPTKELLAAFVLDLKDPSDDIRLLAVRSLGRLGSAASSTIANLEPLLTDPDRDVRKATADAILRISGP
jgi:HEAT repeats/HEAT repeat